MGIKAALSICQAQYQNQDKIQTFSLEKLEKYSQFKISTKLYGRSLAIDALQSICGKVFAGATEMVVVRGDSGLGKTALVNRTARAIVKQKGYFITGKYEQLTNTTPYGAIVRSFWQFGSAATHGGCSPATSLARKNSVCGWADGKVMTGHLARDRVLVRVQQIYPTSPAKETHNRFRYRHLSSLLKFLLAQYIL